LSETPSKTEITESDKKELMENEESIEKEESPTQPKTQQQ